MNYEEAMNFIQNTSKFGSVLGLDNIKELLERLGNPQDQLKVVHIAGTNGKGSVLAYTSTILSEAGYRNQWKRINTCISCRNLQRKWISCGEVCLPGIFLLRREISHQ